MSKNYGKQLFNFYKLTYIQLEYAKFFQRPQSRHSGPLIIIIFLLVKWNNGILMMENYDFIIKAYENLLLPELLLELILGRSCKF